jgi:uncharacterized protein YfaA (DUF2138 family)
MRRSVIIGGLVMVSVIAGAVAYLAASRKDFHYSGTRLMADLARPDAVIRTASLSQLPRDLLQVPIARDVLTEDLVFYYEQHEDRLGLNGAIKRIAYEHQLGWADRILASALNEPAEVALWRDGKGALRHFAIVMRRNTLSKVIHEIATVALQDSQLKAAGEIETGNGTAKAYALTLSPRRTLLLLAEGERVVVLSDPGLLFDQNDKMLPEARQAIAEWLDEEGALAEKFALDDTQSAEKAGRPRHTLAVGASTLALGYGAFMPGFKGLRFDFGQTWSTSVWIDPQGLPAAGLGNTALWRAAPANPSACVALPIDWKVAEKVLKAQKKPVLPKSDILSAFDGSALACWYGQSSLYSPVFIAHLADGFGTQDRNAALQALVNWAFARAVSEDSKATAAAGKNDVMIWHKADPNDADAKADPSAPTVAAYGQYVVFSPDGALTSLVLDTLARIHPSVADQMPASNATLMLLTPNRLADMGQKEVLAVLSGYEDAALKAAAQTHLPPRMEALAAYPPYRLELPAASGKRSASWQRVYWRTPEEGK